jgi:hypothetical protein
MRRGRSRWAFRVAIILVAGVGFLVWALASQSQNRLVIENKFGQPVTELEITVAGQKATFDRIAAGATVTTSLVIKGGEPFTVKGKRPGALINMSGVTVEGARLVVDPTGHVTLRPPGKGGS